MNGLGGASVDFKSNLAPVQWMGEVLLLRINLSDETNLRHSSKSFPVISHLTGVLT